MIFIEIKMCRMISTVILFAALFTTSGASGPTGSQSYGGYGQHQQLQQPQYQQQDRWYPETTPASYTSQPSEFSPNSPTSPEGDELPPLPEGWSEHFDPESGQYYYYCAADGTTCWERPEPTNTKEQGMENIESKVEDSKPAEEKPQSAGATDMAQNLPSEQNMQKDPENIAAGERSRMTQKSEPSNSSENDSWKSNVNQQTKLQEPTQPSSAQHRPDSWGGQGQSEHLQTNEWSPSQTVPEPNGANKWGQQNSTESAVVAAEMNVQQGQPPQTQHPHQRQGQTAGWGLPPKANNEEPSQKGVQPWGVKPDSQRQIQPSAPNTEVRSAPNDISSSTASSDGRWGRPNTAESNPSNMPGQRQPWQRQDHIHGNQQSQDHQRSPIHQDPQQVSRPPPHNQPGGPQYLPRHYPPQYTNAPYGPGHNGGQNPYARGYPPPYGSPSHVNSPGQLVSQPEPGTSAVKDALSNTWKGLLGLGNRTREAVGTARDQVVTSATAAGQTLTEKGSSMWETVQSTVGGVFENNDSSSQPPYSLGQNGHTPPESRPPPGYPGRPTGPNYGYNNIPGGPGGRGPPPRNYPGTQPQPGRYGPQPGQQQPRYSTPLQNGSTETPGQQQPPQMKPPGYPNMYPRRDNPYPQPLKGQERSPMQSQYGNPSSPNQPVRGGYPPQQRPPNSGPPGPQSNNRPGTTNSTPQQENNQSDSWDHPAFSGDY